MFLISQRGRRRLHMENLQRKARLRAEKEGSDSLRRIAYKRAVFAQGKFFNGGCGLARCGICDYFTPSYRQLKQNEQFNQEYREWLRGGL